ncbi:hypothetical protein FACS1894105_14250 [Clostridia bacterium]|nr:hypothetical protein FACS1894105_14250 [Clostridia bacterium]
MKTRDFIKMLYNNGWSFKRRGANHDIYAKGKEQEPCLARHVIKKLTTIWQKLSSKGGG